MKKYITIENQTLLDICLICYGNLDYVAKLAADNNLDVITPIPVGSIVYYGDQIASWNFIKTINANDYFQIYWSSSSTDISIKTIGAQSIPDRPETPSVIITAQQIMYTEIGPQGPSGAPGTTIILPVPNIKLGGTAILEYIDSSGNSAGKLTLRNAPYIVANDITEELINTGNVFVEMLIYKRRHNKVSLNELGQKVTSPKNSGYVVPSPYILDIDNTQIWNVPWPKTFWSRNGSPHIIKGNKIMVSRPNHYGVTFSNKNIPVYEYLNGRFISEDVAYRTTSGTTNFLPCIIPVSNRQTCGKNSPTNRFAYSPYFTPIYIAFRYVYWDPTANFVDGKYRGQIISGPVSRTIKVSSDVFPFPADYYNSSIIGTPVTTPNKNYIPANLRCWIENSLP